jgi:hypothetical protein
MQRLTLHSHTLNSAVATLSNQKHQENKSSLERPDRILSAGKTKKTIVNDYIPKTSPKKEVQKV